MSTRVKARAKGGALTRLTWSGGKKGKDWHFEEKRRTGMGEGRKVDVLVHCKTRDAALTYDGVYDSITNELTFYRPTEEDTWEGVIYFDPISLPMNGPYIESKNGKEWVAKNWKWWRNTGIGTAVLAGLGGYVKKMKGETAAAKTELNHVYNSLHNVGKDNQKVLFAAAVDLTKNALKLQSAPDSEELIEQRKELLIKHGNGLFR